MIGNPGKVAVALFIFNRPSETERVMHEIRKYAPERLLIVADGPRADRAGEARSVKSARDIAQNIDWECSVTTKFSDHNLGCKKSISSGLKWVFEHCEEAIILEDDCVPCPAFFDYASEMLELYRRDYRIHSISGSYFGEAMDLQGHYFSNYSLMWGWATWKDRWANYQLEPSDAKSVVSRMWKKRILPYLYWRRVFEELGSGQIDTWDFQWILTAWRHNKLTVRPTVNLVENIGFNELATHTKKPMSASVLSISHRTAINLSNPISEVEANAALDRYDERRWALINVRSVVRMYVNRLLQRLGAFSSEGS